MTNTAFDTVHHVSTFNVWYLFVVPALLSYLILCSLLRFQRLDAMHRKYNYTDRKSLRQMTNDQAQEITAYMSQLEFPKIYYTSVQFALFKTYGIPTISQLLVATKEFSTPENASKRYADTGVLIQEFTTWNPRNERTIKAIARMNYIHSGYQKAGKISNDDLLYTLSVFITEPISWVRKFEWRSMSDMEICAVGTLWKSIGDAMGIEYRGRLEKNEWKDGIEFYEDIRAWAEKYEAKYMVPAVSNKITADELVPLLLFYVPKRFKAVAADLVGVLMGDLLRKSMIYPEPSKGSILLTNAIFGIRKFILRYASLPRPKFLLVRELNEHQDPKTGRFHTNRYLVHPYYNKPGFFNRWGPEGWFTWFFDGDVPGSKGNKYIPEGYTFQEVGPRGMKNKGGAEMRAWEKKLMEERPAGCPFSFSR